jgi:hypothetical protein
LLFPGFDIARDDFHQGMRLNVGGGCVSLAPRWVTAEEFVLQMRPLAVYLPFGHAQFRAGMRRVEFALVEAVAAPR